MNLKSLLFVLCFALCFMQSEEANAQADLIITEIMYNDAGFGTDTLEYIEIYNAGTAAIDISGYYLGGATFTFPAGTMVMPNEYVVTAYSANNMLNTFGVTALEWTGGGLSNGGELVSLFDVTGAMVDEVPYDDTTIWPASDGTGYSIELCDFSADNSLANSWKVSGTYAGIYAGKALYGSPNMANDTCNACIPTSAVIDAAICDGEMYTFPDGMMESVAGSYTTVVMNADGCDSTIITNLTVNPSYETVENIMLCDGDTYVLSDGTVVTMSGVYMVTDMSIAGCDSIMTSDVMIGDAIVATTTVTNVTCAGNDGSAEAMATGGTPPYMYTWMAGGSTASTMAITGLAPGMYEVEVMDANGCIATAMATVADACVSACQALMTADLMSDVDATGATLSWSAVPNAEAYQLAGRKLSGTTKVFPETQNTTRTFPSAALQPATTYQWSIRVKCDGVWTDYALDAGPASFTTPAAKNNANSYDIFAEGNSFSTALYPNPTSNAATLELNHAVNFSGEAITSNITITDVTGKAIDTFKTTNARLTLNVNEYTNGYYFVVVTSGAEKSVEKMMIAH